jgi:pimeloyl-ACP methyl ester carboxylesterase
VIAGSTAADDRFCTVGDGQRLCYRVHGRPSDEPVVLVAGLGLQLTSWPTAMVDALVGRGFFVVTFDNRDTGRSSPGPAPAPDLLRLLARRPRADGYDLADMAGDAVGLLDHLKLPSAHIVGMSMGGMIGQTMAARHPDRVRTLTSIFSTTGGRDVGQPAATTTLRLARPAARSRAEAIETALAMRVHIAAGPFGIDQDAMRAYLGQAWDRGQGATAHLGVARQINAILRSGDRAAELRRITAPTLVIHGDRDLLVHPSGGRATADAIPGARHVVIAGMRHHLADALVPRLVELTTDHVHDHAPATRSRAAGAT